MENGSTLWIMQLSLSVCRYVSRQDRGMVLLMFHGSLSAHDMKIIQISTSPAYHGYGKKKRECIIGFNIYTYPATKTTCQEDRTS